MTHIIGHNELTPDPETLQPFVARPAPTILPSGATITSADLTSPTTPAITQPEPTPVPPVPSASSFTVTPTPKETEVSDLIKRIQKSTETLTEAKGFRIGKEKELGLEEAKRSEEEFLTQLKQLELEAKTIPERLQLEATGRGITAGGLAPIQAGELRKVSIAANTTAALLLGAQGRVIAAQRNIDAAVRAKYGQEEANQKALLANLELALKDPTLTAEQKARAEAQKVIQEKKEEDRKKKEADAKTILEWATKAPSGGATAEQAQIIANIGLSDNPDLGKAFELYSPFAPKEKDTDTNIASFKAFFPNVDITTPAGQQQFLNWKAREAAAGREGGGATKTLDILDVGRYNELYPEAGVTAGDTKATADAKVAALNTPEAKTRSLVVAAKNNGNSYEKVIKEIKNDTTIKDKETAIKVAGEVYGIAPKVTAEPVFGKDNFAKTSLDEELSRLQTDNVANGFPKNTGLREDLAQKGYPIKEIDKRLSPIQSAVSGFIESIGNFLFGK